MAAGNPAWLGLLPPPNTSVLNTMGNVFRFVFRIVRGIFPRCFRLNKISKLKAVTEKQALLNSSASDAEAAVPLLRQEQVAAISPAVSTVSTATQAEHGKLEDSAVPQTIPVEVYMALKQRLELLQMENALLTEEMNRRLELLQAENTLLTEEMQLVQEAVANNFLPTPSDTPRAIPGLTTPRSSEYYTPKTMAYLRSLLPTDRSPAPSSTASQPVPRVLQLDTTPDMLQNGTPASTLGSESVMIQSPSAHWVGPDIRRDLEAQKLPASPPVMRLPLAEMLSKDSMECSGTPRSSRVAFGQLSSDRPAATTLHSAAFVLAQDHASGGAENQPPVVVGVPNTTSKYKETTAVKRHDTPFEARVDRTLNDIAAYEKNIRAESISPEFVPGA